MSRNRDHVHYHLHPKQSTSLPENEIRAILRGADALIAVGGRSMLSKILKGSRAKDVLAYGLDRNPSHGFYRDLPVDEVTSRIDWTITHGYLRVIYEGKLPVLAYTGLGWEIERETCGDELIAGFDDLLARSQRPYDMRHLLERSRDLILHVLQKIEAGGDARYVPVLEDWALVDCRKVRQRIGEVMLALEKK